MRHRSGATREDEEIGRPGPPRSPVEIGQVLRRAREERGLDLLSVHDRIGRPITQLEALELGSVSTVHDQIALVSTLRNYAAFLGLDGDGLALALIDQWSRPAGASQGPGRSSSPTGVPVTQVAGPEHLRAFTQTGRVDAVRSPTREAAPAFAGASATGPATGVLPAVGRHDSSTTKLVRSARRRRRAPLALRLVTWLVAVAVVVGIGGLAAQRWRPQWLARFHLEHVVSAAAPSTVPSSSVRSAGGRARTVRPAPRPALSVAPVVLTSSGHTAATYSVATHRFTVTLATSAPCWVQVSSPASVTPVAEGVQPAGKTTRYPATGTMTVQVGASGVLVGIVVDGRTRFTVAPQQAPYTYTFRGA
jgi:cytoskeletal protein RodZ